MKKKIKKKNPAKLDKQKWGDFNLHRGSIFYNYLLQSFLEGNPSKFSQALNYLNIGINCSDCGEYFEICACEGARDTPGKPCEDCNENYCICDYEMKTVNDLRNSIIDVIIKYLDVLQIKDFYIDINHKQERRNRPPNLFLKFGVVPDFSPYIKRLENYLSKVNFSKRKLKITKYKSFK